jgi:hypothetical protein
MEMKSIVVEGTLQTLGESTLLQNGNKTYTYISFLNEDGGNTVANKVSVRTNEIDHILTPGGAGVFVFAKSWFGNEMVAARVNNQEAIAYNLIRPNWVMIYIALLFVALFFAALSFVLIGLPFLALTLWYAMTLPGNVASVRAQLSNLGFDLKGGKSRAF